MKAHYDVIIIGGGASGLFCASLLDRSLSVAILESNPKCGAKLSISGGGKCNITNTKLGARNYLGDQSFIESVLKRFNNDALLRYLKKERIPFLEQARVAEGQIFLESAKRLVSHLENKLSTVEIFTNTKVSQVHFEKGFFIHTDTQTFQATTLVIASGGLSYQNIGASSIGYEIAKYFQHTVTQTQPALVGFTVQKDEFWFKELSGVSCNALCKIGDKTLRGEMLFTHKGCSGPVILNASLYWKSGKITLDFLPDIHLKQLLVSSNHNKNISTVIPLPKRFVKSFLERVGIADKKVALLSKEEITALSTLKNYEFAPAGNFGYTKAEITKGGILTSEFNPKTMQSNLQKGLYAIGEVLNVDGELGGYNLQWAFSSAFVCAQEINKSAKISK